MMSYWERENKRERTRKKEWKRDHSIVQYLTCYVHEMSPWNQSVYIYQEIELCTEREREREWPVLNSRWAFERSVTCLYLENRFSIYLSRVSKNGRREDPKQLKHIKNTEKGRTQMMKCRSETSWISTQKSSTVLVKTVLVRIC